MEVVKTFFHGESGTVIMKLHQETLHGSYHALHITASQKPSTRSPKIAPVTGNRFYNGK